MDIINNDDNNILLDKDLNYQLDEDGNRKYK